MHGWIAAGWFTGSVVREPHVQTLSAGSGKWGKCVGPGNFFDAFGCSRKAWGSLWSSLWAHMGRGQTARGGAGNTRTMFWRDSGGAGIAKIMFRRTPGGVGITKKCSGGSQEPLDLQNNRFGEPFLGWRTRPAGCAASEGFLDASRRRFGRLV